VKGSYIVERVHECLICRGKDSNGKPDRDGMNLSFLELRRLLTHYGKHLYDEGKVFPHVPLGDNVDLGKGIDQFGATYKYKCKDTACWKSKKPQCGYKEFALHMLSDHDTLEEVLAVDPRPALRSGLLSSLREARERQREADRPLYCLVPGCPEAGQGHTRDQSYRSLRQHYALAHWRPWFLVSPGRGQPVRTQRLTMTGAHCLVCNLKMFGDDAKMMEHYAVVHGRLEAALLDRSVGGVPAPAAVISQLFPSLLPRLGPGGRGGEGRGEG
jgi:hypothetical protein